MTAAQFEQLDDTDAVGVLRWRIDVRLRAGFDFEQAATVAAHVDVDLHRAVELIDRGCPTETAIRILV
jgi:hypothetical protein